MKTLLSHFIVITFEFLSVGNLISDIPDVRLCDAVRVLGWRKVVHAKQSESCLFEDILN